MMCNVLHCFVKKKKKTHQTWKQEGFDDPDKISFSSLIGPEAGP